MQELPKRVVIASIAVAAIVMLAALCDLFMGVPFSGQFTMVMDILFIISGGIVIYLGLNSYQELS